MVCAVVVAAEVFAGTVVVSAGTVVVVAEKPKISYD